MRKLKLKQNMPATLSGNWLILKFSKKMKI